MANRAEMLIEANRRGLLTGQKKTQFDEAVKRGLITLPAEQATDEQLSQVGVAQPLSPFQQAQLQSTVVYPAEETSLGAFVEGAQRSAERYGTGILQRDIEVADFFGLDRGPVQATAEFLGYDIPDNLREQLSVSEQIQQQKIKQTEEDKPVATTLGSIGGTIATVPSPAGKLQAIGTGAFYGLGQPAETGKEIALNVVQEGALGGLGAWAAPYLQKGFNKSQAMFSGLVKKVTGADPRPGMFTPEGSLSESGQSALREMGISEEEFARLYQTLDQNLEPIPAARQQRAREAGFELTPGQAERDFAKQEAEDTLRANITREGTRARRLEEEQQEGIRTAKDQFTGQFEGQADRQLAGGDIQSAVQDIRTTGKENISRLYKEAKETEGIEVPLDNDSLLGFIDETLFERPVEDAVIKSLEKKLAKFGLIGGDPEQSGRFYQVVDDDGSVIKFVGEQTPLTLSNAEDFRKSLNQVYQSDKSGSVGQIIKALDNQVDQVIDQLPEGAARTAAFKKARAAAREQKEIFEAKDIIQGLTSYKKGTRTDTISPDRVVDSIIKNKDSLTNIQKVKKILMDNPTNKSVDAWKSIQAQTAADVFSKSINPNGEISGNLLNSAVKKFGNGSMEQGEKRLKEIFGDKYGEFDNLRKAIGDATIPLKGTQNPSGTAHKIFNMLTRFGTLGIYGADAVLPLVNKAKDSLKSGRVLKNIENYTPNQVKQAVKANDELVDSFVRLGLSGTLREIE